MKKLITFFSIIMIFTNVSFAHVSIEDASQNLIGNLVDFQINQEWLEATNDGSILINLDENKIQLILQEVVECPKGMACIALAPTIIDSIEVELISKNVDACGAVTYVGEKDNTPVDGLKETITVVDNRDNYCHDILTTQLTSVTYTTFNPWAQDTVVSYIGGDELVPQPSFFGGMEPLHTQPAFK